VIGSGLLLGGLSESLCSGFAAGFGVVRPAIDWEVLEAAGWEVERGAPGNERGFGVREVGEDVDVLNFVGLGGGQCGY
jgi:hypothetical protein